MEDRVKAAVAAVFFPEGDRPVAVALSGGRDSVALLHALINRTPKINSLSALHIDHGLRPEAEEEAAFVRALCRTWNVPLSVVSVNVPANRRAGESMEAAARRLRYQAFEENAPQDALIATAHHAGDQAETVVQHLLRGSGLRGLGGMAPQRGRYIRPLLGVTREDIDAYCTRYALAYVEDSSNADVAIQRNRIRHELMPVLKEYNPQIVPALAAMADTLREDEAYFEQQAQQALTENGFSVFGGEAAVVDRAAFNRPAPIQKRMIRQMLRAIGAYDLTQTAFLHALQAVNTGRSATLPGHIHVRGGAAVQVYRPAMPVPEQEFSEPGQYRFGVFNISVGLGAPMPARGPWCAHVSPAVLTHGLSVRLRRPKDTVAMPYGSALLSDLMMDRKVPFCLRDRVPVFTADGAVVWAPGVPPSAGINAVNGDGVCHITVEGIDLGGYEL